MGKRQIQFSSGHRIHRGLAALSVGIMAVIALPAHAQFSNGAVIVTVPDDDDETTPAAKAPAAKRPPPKAKPKPRRKARRTAAKRTRRAPSRSRPTRSSAASKLKIAVLVNDDPITQYEIRQRATMLAGRSGLGKRAQANFKRLIKRKSTNTRLRAILKQTIEANQGRSRQHILAIFERRKKAYALGLQRQAVSLARKSVLPGLRRKATQELIEERLKIQAAKRAKVLIPKSQLDNVMTGIAKRNKLSYAAFRAQLRKQGTDINSMRARIRAQMSWLRLINAKFGRFVDVNQKTIDETVIGGNDAEKVSIHIHRFLFRLPNKIDQRIVTQRMVEAQQARTAFRGCQNSRSFAQSKKGITFRDLGFRVAAEVAEPTRSLLLNARDNEMAPPVTTQDGVALYAICGRRAGNRSFAARAAAERNLRQKGTEIYGRKYLSDLRREAHIEYRTR